jgi:pyruvate dehydrogenase E2 component (dihydrolipoamide acetyltransferase)
MTEGTLLRWLKEEGDTVTRGEVIAEIETDKANVEIEAFESGVFRKALAREGDTVNVGEVIAIIAGAEDDISTYGAAPAPAAKEQRDRSAATATKAPAPEAARAAGDAPTKEATPAGEQPPTPAPPADVRPPQPPAPAAPQAAPAQRTNGRLRASPLAKRIAEQRGIDLQGVRGTGPDGRILQRDVEAAAAGGNARPAAPSPGPGAATPAQAPSADTAVTPTRMRQAIARRMSQSKREAPHYYLLVDIDMTDAMAMRAQLNETVGEDARVSINDLVVRACAIALRRHPAFNATIDGDQVTQRAQQNVCIAIALDDGLIAPALIDAGSKSLLEIAREARDLIARAKGGALRPDEVTAGTFSVTNLGPYGVETLIGIIQPPQTAILGAGSVMPQAAVHEGAVTVRQLMKVALSADHRVTDGAQGALFLAEIKRLLEKPLSLLL